MLAKMLLGNLSNFSVHLCRPTWSVFFCLFSGAGVFVLREWVCIMEEMLAKDVLFARSAYMDTTFQISDYKSQPVRTSSNYALRQRLDGRLAHSILMPSVWRICVSYLYLSSMHPHLQYAQPLRNMPVTVNVMSKRRCYQEGISSETPLAIICPRINKYEPIV